MVWSESWIALLGVSLLLIAGWSWRGRSSASRWWIRIRQGDTMALGFAPGLGLVFLGLGVIALVPGDEAAETPAGMIASLVWLAGLAVFAVGSWGPALVGATLAPFDERPRPGGGPARTRRRGGPREDGAPERLRRQGHETATWRLR